MNPQFLTTVLRRVILVVLAGLVLLPVWATVITAFQPVSALARGGLLPDPTRLTLDNVRAAVAAVPLAQQYLVSVLVTVLQAGAQVVTAASAAYALVFVRWRYRGAAFVLIIATLAIPSETTVIPNYETVSGLGLRDTVLAVALPYLAVAYPVFLLRQAFLAIPTEIWEAARLDGAGHLRCLTRIILPIVAPQLLTAVLWSALAAWNGYFWPLLITDSANHRTVQVGLTQLVAGQSSTPGVVYAGTLLVLAPTAVLVIVGRRFLLRGLASRV